MAAAAAAFGAERFRRYGAGSSDPTTPSACELARVGGRLAQWSGNGGAHAAAAAAAPPTELVLHFDKVTHFDRIFLSEDVANDGQLIAKYTIDLCSSTASGGAGTSTTVAAAATGGCDPSSSAGWVKLVIADNTGGP